MLPSIENSKLVESINTLRTAPTELNHRIFYSRLYHSQLYFVVNDSDSNEDLHYVILIDKANRSYLPAFTDEQELYKWNIPKEYAYAVIRYRECVEVFHKEECSQWYGIVLNPYTHNLVIKKDMLATVAQEASFIPPGDQVFIGEPNQKPTALLNLLHDILPTYPSVHNAYLLLLMRENRDSKSFILVLDEQTNSSSVFDEIAHHVKQITDSLEFPVDIYSSTDSTLFSDTIKRTKPFYSKDEK